VLPEGYRLHESRELAEQLKLAPPKSAGVVVMDLTSDRLPRRPPADAKPTCPRARPAPSPRPNDVLVSSTLRDLVIGSGLEFADRGAYELKGVPGEWHLFAVV
jgi:hypothetical protein